jgi:hypothetical protein
MKLDVEVSAFANLSKDQFDVEADQYLQSPKHA